MSVETVRRGIPGPTILRNILAKYSLVFAVIVLIVGFSIAEPSTFPTEDTFKVIFRQQSAAAILALAVIFPLAAGEFDFSVAAVLGLAQLFVIGLMGEADFSPVVAIVIVLLGGALVGVINGILVVRLRLSSFIATLGVSTILGSIGVAYAGAKVLFEGVPTSFTDLARAESLGVPRPLLYLIVVAVLAWLFLEFTPRGRFLYAIGGSPSAARLAGVPIDSTRMLAFIVAGTLSALAGILIASEAGSGQPTLGPQFLLPAFAAAFLGTTSNRPGRFNVGGTVIGVFFLAIGVTGLQLMGATGWVTGAFNGTALIVAVYLSGILRRGRVASPER